MGDYNGWIRICQELSFIFLNFFRKAQVPDVIARPVRTPVVAIRFSTDGDLPLDQRSFLLNNFTVKWKITGNIRAKSNEERSVPPICTDSWNIQLHIREKNKMNDKSERKKEKFLHLDTPLDLYAVGNQANSSFLNRMISQTITGVNKRGQLSRS